MSFFGVGNLIYFELVLKFTVMHKKYLGSQFSVGVVLPAFTFSQCSEIEIVLYNERYTEKSVMFSKLENTIFNELQDDKTLNFMVSSNDTRKLGVGTIRIEIKRVVDGENQPILKSQLPIFSIEKSYTT